MVEKSNILRKWLCNPFKLSLQYSKLDKKIDKIINNRTEKIKENLPIFLKLLEKKTSRKKKSTYSLCSVYQINFANFIDRFTLSFQLLLAVKLTVKVSLMVTDTIFLISIAYFSSKQYVLGICAFFQVSHSGQGKNPKLFVLSIFTDTDDRLFQIRLGQLGVNDYPRRVRPPRNM